MDSSHVLLKKPIHSNSGFRFDPNKFKGGDEETTTSMQTYLVEKCREQGFYLRPTINCKRTKRGKRLATLDFVCDHNAAPVQSTPSVAKSKKLIRLSPRRTAALSVETHTLSNLNPKRRAATSVSEFFVVPKMSVGISPT